MKDETESPSHNDLPTVDLPETKDTDKVAECTNKVSDRGELTRAHGDHDVDGAILIVSPHLHSEITDVNVTHHTLLCEIEGHGTNKNVADKSNECGTKSTTIADNGTVVV